MRKLTVGVCLFLFIALSANGASTLTLFGILGKGTRIQMALSVNGFRVTGNYLYEKYRIPIRLEGSIDNAGGTQLAEFNDRGQRTGVFVGKLTSSSFTGTWTSADGRKSLPFNLSAGTAAGQVSPPQSAPRVTEIRTVPAVLGQRKFLAAYTTDLNSDGKMDYFIARDGSCGSGGCSYEIYVAKGNSYVKLPGEEVYIGSPRLVSYKTEGFWAIALESQDGSGMHRNIFEYHGGRYVLVK